MAGGQPAGGIIQRGVSRQVATAGGQITEGTYVAESEERLRHELEERGLFVLSVQGAGALKLGNIKLSLPRRRRVKTSEFLIFNQELATLLKAGLPLVQSLDILRRRVPNPMFRATLDDIHDKVRSGTSLSEAFEAQHMFSGSTPRRSWPVRRAAASSRSFAGTCST
jgi:type IV pilus assembly protein PilC